MENELKDVIIGGASNYDWSKLQYWVRSIQMSGFTGDVVLCATNISGETIKKLREYNVIIHGYGKPTEDGGFENDSKNAPHVERFIYIWDYLTRNKGKYRYSIITDTRDVIFQSDPTEWLKENLDFTKTIVASSEGLLYKDEPWGDKNLLDTFGKYFYNVYRENMIYNVGTIAGTADEVTDLVLLLFQLSINRPVPIVDQAVYNFILNLEQFVHEVTFTTNEDAWAIQLGTTLPAIEGGAGDIGQMARQNPALLEEYKNVYQDKQPTINEHEVVSSEGDKYCIVHQWDRVPGLKEKVMKHYGDSECSTEFLYSTAP